MSVLTNGFEYVSLGIHSLRDRSACLNALSVTRYSVDGTDMSPINPPIIPFVPADGLGYAFYSERESYRCLFHTFTNNTIGDPIYANALKAITFGSATIGFASVYYPFSEYVDNAPFLPFPYSVTGSSNSSQGYNTFHSVSFSAEYFRRVPLATLNTNHPNYRSLVTGYSLDNRTIPNYPIVVGYADTTITIKYYQNNHLEPISNLKSIGWRVYKVDLKASISQVLPIENCVLGTLYIDNINIQNAITSLPTVSGKYSWSDLFPTAIPSLFAGWKALFDATNDNPQGLTIFSQTIILRKLATKRNYWDNTNLIFNNNINFDITHPMFAIDNQRAYNWHIKPQSDGSYGDLVMDGPRTIEMRLMIEQLLTALNALQYQTEIPAIIGTGTVENPETPAKHKLDWYIKNSQGSGIPEAIITKITEIWKALGGAKYATNELDNNQDRVTNLGFLTDRIAKVLGIRLNANGTIDEELEKTTNRRVHADGSEQNDPQEFNPNCFGSEGMLVRHLPNKFAPNGMAAGGYRKVKDIPQLLGEMHEQANAAMGYQEGTAIEIQVDGQTYRYPNQLALLTDIFVTLKQSAVYSKGAFFSSVVGEQSIKEVIGGLGLRTVDKYVEFTVAGKIVKLYYKGVSASQSIRRKMSAMATNIGTIIGNIT